MAVDAARRKKSLTITFDPNIDIWSVSLENAYGVPQQAQRRKLMDALAAVGQPTRDLPTTASAIARLMGTKRP